MHQDFVPDLVTQVGEDVLKLGQHHGAVLVLVVELAEFDVVVVVALTVGSLLGLVNKFDNIVEGKELLALFLLQG